MSMFQGGDPEKTREIFDKAGFEMKWGPEEDMVRLLGGRPKEAAPLEPEVEPEWMTKLKNMGQAQPPAGQVQPPSGGSVPWQRPAPLVGNSIPAVGGGGGTPQVNIMDVMRNRHQGQRQPASIVEELRNKPAARPTPLRQAGLG